MIFNGNPAPRATRVAGVSCTWYDIFFTYERILSMSKVFIRPDGTYSRYAPTREEARKLKQLRYDDQQPCPVCADCSIKFVHNGECIHCKRLEAMQYYNMVAVGAPLPKPMPAALEALDASPSGYFPVTQADAVARGIGVWVRVEACAKAGHLGVRVVNGGCWYCEREKPTTSPRQAAITAGETHYTPVDPCPTCGQCAPRRVSNGQCQGCNPPKRVPAEKDLGELVIGRDDAIALGMKVYRTGKACKRGHTAARYVSTRGCVECV